MTAISSGGAVLLLTFAASISCCTCWLRQKRRLWRDREACDWGHSGSLVRVGEDGHLAWKDAIGIESSYHGTATRPSDAVDSSALGTRTHATRPFGPAHISPIDTSFPSSPTIPMVELRPPPPPSCGNTYRISRVSCEGTSGARRAGQGLQIENRISVVVGRPSSASPWSRSGRTTTSQERSERTTSEEEEDVELTGKHDYVSFEIKQHTRPMRPRVAAEQRAYAAANRIANPDGADDDEEEEEELELPKIGHPSRMKRARNTNDKRRMMRSGRSP